MIKDNCLGTFLRFGHRFQPRYDEKRWGPQWLEDSLKKLTKLNGYPEKDYTKTYVQDGYGNIDETERARL